MTDVDTELFARKLGLPVSFGENYVIVVGVIALAWFILTLLSVIAFVFHSSFTPALLRASLTHLGLAILCALFFRVIRDL